MRAALKDGFITAADIGERFSHREALRKQLHTQMLQNELKKQEAEAPLIQPRADLAGGQVGAALDLLPKQTQLAGGTLDTANTLQPGDAKLAKISQDQAAAEQLYGKNSIASFQQLAPLVPGYDGKAPTKADGTPDFGQMAQEGTSLSTQMGLRSQAMEHLKAVEHRPGKNEFGQTTVREINGVSEDITPGSDAHKYWNNVLNRPFQFKSLKPGSDTSGQPAAPAGQPAAQSQPSTPAPNAPAANDAAATPGRPQVGSYNPGAGMVTGDVEPPKEGDITEQFRKQKSYENWNQARPFFGAMTQVMNDINKTPIAEQRKGSRNLNVKDIDLISNFVKAYDPTAVIREFKFDKIQSSQPLPDQLKNWMSTITRSGQLTPESRQELYNTAASMMKAKEDAIAPDLQMAKKKAEDSGYPVGHILNPAEQEILTRNQSGGTAPAASAQPATATAAQPSQSYAGKQWTLGASYTKGDGSSWTVTGFDSSGRPTFEPKK